MKQIRLGAILALVSLVFACENDEYSLNVVNSKSFPESQISIDAELKSRLASDSLVAFTEKNTDVEKLNEMISRSEELKLKPSDSQWILLVKEWKEYQLKRSVVTADSGSASLAIHQKWAELNANLLCISGEVRFGDILDDLLHQSNSPLSERFLKSVIYTHNDDRIFVNLFTASSLVHRHTTGGTIKLIQESHSSNRNEITLRCECADTRFLDVFVRIPEWAVNPTVTHGNVKYVPHPGEYCEISRMWKNGDEIQIVMKN